jgi:ATP-dependent Zn protease
VEAVESADALIRSRRKELEALVAALIERETIEKKELYEILGPAVTAPHAIPAEPYHTTSARH